MGAVMPSLLCFDPSNDPKGHTGVAEIDFTPDSPATLSETWAVPGGIAPILDFLSVGGGVQLYPDTVVCEHFVPYNRNADIGPAYVEGAIQAMFYPDTPVVLQPSSGKDTNMSDRHMNLLGFDKKDFAGDHHADRWQALKHGLLYLRNQRHMPTLRAMTGRAIV